LECASGDAVRMILRSNLGRIIDIGPGAYGGEKRTVLVSVSRLEEACAHYWQRANEYEARIDRDSCHYCGMKATDIGFFDEPVCPECGG